MIVAFCGGASGFQRQSLSCRPLSCVLTHCGGPFRESVTGAARCSCPGLAGNLFRLVRKKFADKALAVLASKAGCGCISDRKETQQGTNAEEVAGESRQRHQRCPLQPGTGCIERRNGETWRRIRLRMLQAALATAWDGSPKGRDSRAGSVHDSPGSRREVAHAHAHAHAHAGQRVSGTTAEKANFRNDLSPASQAEGMRRRRFPLPSSRRDDRFFRAQTGSPAAACE